MEERLKEIKNKCEGLKAELFDLVAHLENGKINTIKMADALTNAEQGCTEEGIGIENPLRVYKKTAALIYAFNEIASKKEGPVQRDSYTKWALMAYGYTPIEIESVTEIIKGLEGKVK
jgi:hypothetical protein